MSLAAHPLQLAWSTPSALSKGGDVVYPQDVAVTSAARVVRGWADRRNGQ
jgi:hypothetical protein